LSPASGDPEHSTLFILVGIFFPFPQAKHTKPRSSQSFFSHSADGVPHPRRTFSLRRLTTLMCLLGPNSLIEISELSSQHLCPSGFFFFLRFPPIGSPPVCPKPSGSPHLVGLLPRQWFFTRNPPNFTSARTSRCSPPPFPTGSFQNAGLWDQVRRAMVYFCPAPSPLCLPFLNSQNESIFLYVLGISSFPLPTKCDPSLTAFVFAHLLLGLAVQAPLLFTFLAPP